MNIMASVIVADRQTGRCGARAVGESSHFDPKFSGKERGRGKHGLL